MMNAIIYVRVSKKNMDYQRQISDLETVAKQRGYAIVETLTEKISGAKSNKERPTIQRLMKLAKEGAFQTVFVSEVSRLGRNTFEVLEVVEGLTNLGINIYIETYSLETIVKGKKNPMAQFMITLLAEIGRLEREFLIERTKSGLENAKRNGKILGRPEGTKKNDQKIIEEYAGIVKSLKKGLSVREAAKVNDVSNNTVMKVKKALANS